MSTSFASQSGEISLSTTERGVYDCHSKSPVIRACFRTTRDLPLKSRRHRIGRLCLAAVISATVGVVSTLQAGMDL